MSIAHSGQMFHNSMLTYSPANICEHINSKILPRFLHANAASHCSVHWGLLAAGSLNGEGTFVSLPQKLEWVNTDLHQFYSWPKSQSSQNCAFLQFCNSLSLQNSSSASTSNRQDWAISHFYPTCFSLQCGELLNAQKFDRLLGSKIQHTASDTIFLTEAIHSHLWLLWVSMWLWLLTY